MNKSALTTPAKSLIYSDIFKDLEDTVDENEFNASQKNANKNINIAIFHDDASYLDLLVKKMKRRGVKIIEFPTG